MKKNVMMRAASVLLIMVLLTGSELFTGNMLLCIPLLDRRITSLQICAVRSISSRVFISVAHQRMRCSSRARPPRMPSCARA